MKTVSRKRLPARRDAEATRAALLAAGENVFAAKSFEGATFEAIADEAGVNKALISYYFGSKEGLYDAVIEALAAAVLADIEARLGSENADPAKRFGDYVRAMTMALCARPTMPAILMREYLAGAMQERKSPALDVLQFFRTTERLYTAGRKAGRFRPLDPHILHLSIVGPIALFIIAAKARRAAVRRYARDIGDPGAAAFAAAHARLILDGLRRSE